MTCFFRFFLARFGYWSYRVHILTPFLAWWFFLEKIFQQKNYWVFDLKKWMQSHLSIWPNEPRNLTSILIIEPANYIIWRRSMVSTWGGVLLGVDDVSQSEKKYMSSSDPFFLSSSSSSSSVRHHCALINHASLLILLLACTVSSYSLWHFNGSSATAFKIFKRLEYHPETRKGWISAIGLDRYPRPFACFFR